MSMIGLLRIWLSTKRYSTWGLFSLELVRMSKVAFTKMLLPRRTLNSSDLLLSLTRKRLVHDGGVLGHGNPLVFALHVNRAILHDELYVIVFENDTTVIGHYLFISYADRVCLIIPHQVIARAQIKLDF